MSIRTLPHASPKRPLDIGITARQNGRSVTVRVCKPVQAPGQYITLQHQYLVHPRHQNIRNIRNRIVTMFPMRCENATFITSVKKVHGKNRDFACNCRETGAKASQQTKTSFLCVFIALSAACTFRIECTGIGARYFYYDIVSPVATDTICGLMISHATFINPTRLRHRHPAFASDGMPVA